MTIQGFRHYRPEMEFVRFLLLKMLGTGVIKFEVGFDDDVAAAAATKVRDALISFNRAKYSFDNKLSKALY